MNRNAIIKGSRKVDARMPFEANNHNNLSGYLYPQLHKNMRQLQSARKRKNSHE